MVIRMLRELQATYPALHIESLDDLESDSVPTAFTLDTIGTYANPRLANALSVLPPGIIHNLLGETTLLWVWAQNENYRRFVPDRIKQQTGQLLGKELDTLDAVRKTQEQFNGHLDLRTMLKMYDMTTKFPTEKIPLGQIIDKHSRGKLSDTQRRHYTIRFSTIEDEGYSGYEEISGDPSYNFYHDTPISVVISYKGAPNAIVSMYLRNNDTLVINQMQGIRAERSDGTYRGARGLARLNHQEFLLDIGKACAKANDCSGLVVRSILHSDMIYNYRADPRHISPARGLRLYDWFAAKHGGVPDGNCDWHMPMEQVDTPTWQPHLTFALAAPRMFQMYRKEKKKRWR